MFLETFSKSNQVATGGTGSSLETITLLHKHGETDRYGDRTENKLWGIVRGAIGVVVETGTITTEAARSLSAHALSLYQAAPGTTLSFEAGARDPEGENVTKIPNPGAVAGIRDMTVVGKLDDAEEAAAKTVAYAYASLASLGLLSFSAGTEEMNAAA